MPSPDPITLDGRTTVIEPGDRVIVRVDAHHTPQELQTLVQQMRERFPDVEFTFVGDGISIEAQKPAPDLTNWFTYHAPKGDDIDAYQEIRHGGMTLALLIEAYVPPSHERDVALERVREAIFWANAARACNPPDGGDG